MKEYQLLGDHDDARIVGFGLGKTGMRHKFDYSDKHPGYELTQTMRNLMLPKGATRHHRKISAIVIDLLNCTLNFSVTKVHVNFPIFASVVNFLCCNKIVIVNLD